MILFEEFDFVKNYCFVERSFIFDRILRIIQNLCEAFELMYISTP